MLSFLLYFNLLKTRYQKNHFRKEDWTISEMLAIKRAIEPYETILENLLDCYDKYNGTKYS